MIEYWSPTPIYYEDIDLNSSGLLDEILQVENKIQHLFNPNVWNDNVYSTIFNCRDIISTYSMTKTYELLNYHTKNYFHCINFSPEEFYLVDSWLNKTFKHGFQDLHMHGTNIVSGCFYYDPTDKFEEGLTFTFYPFIGSTNTYEVSYDYKPGRLIIFPGMLHHKVLYKKNEGTRKSFSFNFFYR